MTDTKPCIKLPREETSPWLDMPPDELGAMMADKHLQPMRDALEDWEKKQMEDTNQMKEHEQLKRKIAEARGWSCEVTEGGGRKLTRPGRSPLYAKRDGELAEGMFWEEAFASIEWEAPTDETEN